MRIDGRTRLLGLVGKGIDHSLSPVLHNHALEVLGENLAYLPFDIDPMDLEDLIRFFPRIGGIGLNVTTPYKAEAAALVRAGDFEAQLTGIVNTLVYREGVALGFGTDGVGFRSWMRSEGIRPGSSGVALLGFGAVARSIAFTLGQEFPLTFISRSPEAVAAVLESWRASGWPGPSIRVLSWEDPTPSEALLTIGSLPIEAARSGQVAAWLAGCDPTGIVVDLNYGAGRTPLRDQAKDRGLIAYDGLGLLVHQAAASLSLWLGEEVPADLLEEGLTTGTE